ncbi:MAG: hypothetical protein PVI92_08805 [Chromatiales bacterium]|jgi:hypothetical protein
MHNARPDPVRRQEFPAEALSPLLDAFTGFREVTRAQAKPDYEEATRKALEAIEAAETERTAVQDTLEMAKDELQAIRRQVDQLVERRDGLERQLRSDTDRRQAVEQQVPAIREDAQARIA